LGCGEPSRSNNWSVCSRSSPTLATRHGPGELTRCSPAWEARPRLHHVRWMPRAFSRSGPVRPGCRYFWAMASRTAV
jgi:hypothetical protein